jgi:glycyl-tRNA synthetase alpha chain
VPLTTRKQSVGSPLSFQDMLCRLSTFWAEQGCVIALPYDVEVGAGTMCPETFLRVLGPQPWRVAYFQPSRRPADGRYGENPNRLLKHTQLQVILKPPPETVQDIYLESLGAIGIDIRHHDIRFEEDNWEAPTLGAWGMGWQVMLDGLEITQFTYFQQSGGVDLEPISAELTYGLERIAAFLQNVEDVYQIKWNNYLTFGEMRRAEELEFSVYDFEKADPDVCRKILDLYEGEATRLLAEYPRSPRNAAAVAPGFSPAPVAKPGDPAPPAGAALKDGSTFAAARAGGTPSDATSDAIDNAMLKEQNTQDIESISLIKNRFPLRKVYDLTLKCSHLFNILDARGAISVTERVALIARVRKLACEVARIYLDRQPAAEVTG